jgi:hypothetical protein
MTILLGCVGLLVLLTLCYAAGACLFASRSDRNHVGLIIVWFVTGYCFVSVLFLLSKITGFGPALFICALALLLLLRKYRTPSFRVTLGYRFQEFAVALAVSVAASIPILVMGARMGTGAFPAEFFSADVPHLLQHVHALASTTAYPPPSLEVYGFSFKYHYGSQAFVALASLLTGLQPHFLMFGVLEPLLAVLTGFLVFDISRRLTGRSDAALLCLLIVLLGSRQYLVNYMDSSAWAFVVRVESFNYRYPNLPNVAGLLIALSAVRCLIDFEQRNMRLAALFLLSILPVFKIPYLVPISAGLAFIYLCELKNRFRMDLLLEICGAAVLAFVCLLVFSYSTAIGSTTIKFNHLGFLDMTAPWQKDTLWIVLLAVATTAAVTRYKPSAGMIRLLALALSPYLVFSLFSFESFNDNQSQIFDLALILAVLFAAVYVVTAWSAGHVWTPVRRFVAVAALAYLIVPGMVSLLHHIWVVTFHPEMGHEHADNRSIADALKHIPVERTLIVTNDLRYPAENYSRDYRQFQLAGIFGHRNFASNIAYGGLSSEEISLYAALSRLFQVEMWPKREIAFLRQKAPITHLLIHKHYRHAKHIPLELIYENNDYAVYRF